MEAIPNSHVDVYSTGTTGVGEGLEEGMRCLIYLIFCDIILQCFFFKFRCNLDKEKGGSV